MEITKEDFEDYEDIRMSGATNMFNLSRVLKLSKQIGGHLTEEKCKKIMHNYSKLKEQFEAAKSA